MSISLSLEQTHVDDEEMLFRRVEYEPDEEFWKVDIPSGLLLVEPAAFRDRECKPSVDRASLCNFDPTWTQEGRGMCGVVILIAQEVRKDDEIKAIGASNVPPTKYALDVIHRPENPNVAHAQIEADPPITKSNTFRRLRAALSNIANRHIRQKGWAIRPYGYREEEQQPTN